MMLPSLPVVCVKGWLMFMTSIMPVIEGLTLGGVGMSISNPWMYLSHH